MPATHKMVHCWLRVETYRQLEIEAAVRNQTEAELIVDLIERAAKDKFPLDKKDALRAVPR